MVAKERLKKFTLFKDFSDAELRKISAIMKEASYPKGAVLYEEGSPAQGLHIIDKGRVRVTRKTKAGGKQVLAVLRANSFFGELSLLDGRSHSASIETLEKTKLLVIRKEDMDKFLKQNPLIAYKMVRDITITICEILRSMNDKFMNMVEYLWM
ncbi:MAG: cyclic nucleotide-binding domain-containing protein [Nitrospirae bacterium]|nr:cyclic nucleotide-binding domain-containing protein [Nitrospirota bacterium]